MALFPRKDHSEGAADKAPLDAEAPTLQRRQNTVGALLREARQGYRGDIPQIAATLRIRAEYLSAIEEGQYDRLPGPVYAQGFVRAYAIHLGLDGDEAVRRFKQETAGLDRPRDLTFPVPLSQRSIPGGSMLLAALILAICGYGVWYYLSTGDRARPERVAAVPADLSSPLAAESPAAPPTPAADQAAGAAPASTPANAPSAAPTPTADQPPATASAAPGGAAPSSTDAGAPAATAAPVPGAPPSGQTAAASASTVEATPIPPPPATAATPVAVESAPPAPPPPASTADAAAPAVLAKAEAAATYGEEPSRITLRAVRDCWVQVRDKDQSLIFTRLLHPGDVYRVPDRRGLILRTGNGSGLQITVDGRPAPSLGGQLRREVLLDPAKLLAGKAVVD